MTAINRCLLCSGAAANGKCLANRCIPLPRQVIAAYLFDRSHQYTDKSSAKCALEDAAVAILDGEDQEAHKHGELDDLLAGQIRTILNKS